MAVRVPSGPSSRNAVTPWARSQRMPSRKRTGCLTCRTQYSGDISSAAEAALPCRLETTGMRGSWKVRVRAKAANSSSMPSMCGEWKAWLTRRRLVLRPRARHTSATSATASASPAMTTESGPLIAARATVSSRPARVSTASSSAAWIAAIAPPAGSACISRPRAATRAVASASDSTPATWAAASSPIECPVTKSGRTPRRSTRRKRATSMANSAGWV